VKAPKDATDVDLNLFRGRQQRLTDVGGDHEFADRLLG
jgi:hypothetical protein